jgi:hypothetical protein
MTVRLPNQVQALIDDRVPGHAHTSYRRWMSDITGAVNTLTSAPVVPPTPPTPPVPLLPTIVRGSKTIGVTGTGSADYPYTVSIGGTTGNTPGLFMAVTANGPSWISLAELFNPGSDFVSNDSGFLLKGIVADQSSLPLTGNTINDAYRVAGDLWVWNGTIWSIAPDPSGVLGIVLAPVTDIGGGTLQKTQFDTKGRKTGTSAATTDNLTEGATNLYFTSPRVLATSLTGLSTATATTITAADTVLSAAGSLQAQVSLKLSDAPSDGTTYGRKNGAWTSAGGSGSGMMPIVTGDVSSGQPTFVYAPNGSLIFEGIA